MYTCGRQRLKHTMTSLVSSHTGSRHPGSSLSATCTVRCLRYYKTGEPSFFLSSYLSFLYLVLFFSELLREFDPFRDQKEAGFFSSLEPMSAVGSQLVDLTVEKREVSRDQLRTEFQHFLMVSLTCHFIKFNYINSFHSSVCGVTRLTCQCQPRWTLTTLLIILDQLIRLNNWTSSYWLTTHSISGR